MAESYNVMVDFSTNSQKDMCTLLGGAIHEEKIGPCQYQVGLGVQAESQSQAYRLAVDVVKAQLEAFTVQAYSFGHVEVYGPEDEQTLFEG